MIRIAVSPRAYRAIKTTLPEGSVVYPPERNSRGQYLLMLDEGAANSLKLKRRHGESLSDVIIRLAATGRLPSIVDACHERGQLSVADGAQSRLEVGMPNPRSLRTWSPPSTTNPTCSRL